MQRRLVRLGMALLLAALAITLVGVPSALAQQRLDLSKPTLVTPPPVFSTSNPRPTLSWQPMPGVVYYQVQFDRHREFINGDQMLEVVDGAQVTLAATENGTYFWRVRAVYADNQFGSWSEVRQLIIDTARGVEPEWMGESFVGQPDLSLPNGDPGGPVVINEICSGCGTDTIELYNPGPNSVNITNWRLTAFDTFFNGFTTVNQLIFDYYFPAYTMPPNSYVQVRELTGVPAPGVFYLGQGVNIPWTADYRGAVILRSTKPAGVDFVRFRSTFGVSTIAPPAGTTWTGPDPLTNLVTFSLGRDRFGTDTNRGSDWTQPQVDTTGGFNAPPAPASRPTAAPVQVSPAANAFVRDPIIIRWNSVPNATFFTYQLDDTAGCVSPYLTSAPFFGLQNDVTVNSPLNGPMYWRVRAENGVGFGPWSPCRLLTVDNVAPTLAPTLLAPLDVTDLTTPRPALRWTAVPGATRYEVGLQFLPVVSCNLENPNTVATVTGLTYTPPQNLVPSFGPGEYCWRVRGVDAAGNTGPWSSVWGFDVLATTGTRSDLNFFTSLTVSLTWMPVSWANGYEIQVDNNSNFSSPELVFYDVLRTDESRTVTVPTDGLWFWRIRAKRDDGTFGAWSPTASFTVRLP